MSGFSDHNKTDLEAIKIERKITAQALKTATTLQSAITAGVERHPDKPDSPGLVPHAVLSCLLIPAIKFFCSIHPDCFVDEDEKKNFARASENIAVVANYLRALSGKDFGRRETHPSSIELVDEVLRVCQAHHDYVHDGERVKEAMLSKKQKQIYKLVGPDELGIFKDVDDFLENMEALMVFDFDGEDMQEILSGEGEVHGNA